MAAPVRALGCRPQTLVSLLLCPGTQLPQLELPFPCFRVGHFGVENAWFSEKRRRMEQRGVPEEQDDIIYRCDHVKVYLAASASGAQHLL